jgi:hypothetical protein
MKNRYIVPVALILLSACSKKSGTVQPDPVNLPVIRAFLQPDQPPVVSINREILANTADTLGEPIKSLTVTIRVDGFSNHLGYSSDGTYHARGLWYPEAGKTYQLIIDYDGGALTAKTTMPAKPVGFSASSNTMTVPSFSGPAPAPIQLTWSNPDNAYYMVVVENVDLNPDSWFDIPQHADQPGPTYQSDPFKSDHVDLDYLKFNDYGTYRVILHRVGPDLVAYYSDQSAAAQTKGSGSYTNIAGALGIFTAINSDTLTVVVQK